MRALLGARVIKEQPLHRSNTFAIETQNLRKVFGDKVAVRDLSLTVRRGEIFGFLGPNGAGKSTSIKMLLGLAQPTSGEAFVLGAPSGDVEVRRKIGFLPENFRFYEWLTPAELLHLHGRLSGVPAAKLRDRVPALIDLVGLTPHRDKRLQNFSKGMLQRIGLAQALIHEPELIFLDEPTSGLDPMGRRLVRDIIRAQRERGATVFLNSHLLSEIEITCDQVVFIREGEVVTSRDLRAPRRRSPRRGARAQAYPGVHRRPRTWCTAPATHAHDVATLYDDNHGSASAHPHRALRAMRFPISCAIWSPPAPTFTSSRRSACHSKICS